MTVNRILQDQALVEEIAKSLEQSSGTPVGAPSLRADELRRMAEQAQHGFESNPTEVQEAIIRRQGRPVFFIQDGRIEASGGGVWSDRIDAARAVLDPGLPAVGRLELAGSADRRVAAGTGWLVAPDVVVTNRHVAIQFASQTDTGFSFNVNPNLEQVEVGIDFLREHARASKRAFDIVGVIHIEPGGASPDVALLKVCSRGGQDEAQPSCIRLIDGSTPVGATVGVVGYAEPDPVLNPQDVTASIFGDVYGVKRFHPGETLEPTRRDLTHDCSTLGGNSGSVVLDFATGKAVGLHYSGYFEKRNYAVPAAKLLEILHKLKIEVPSG